MRFLTRLRGSPHGPRRGYSLWWQPADGSGPAELLLNVPGRDVWEGVFAPDGRTIVYRTGSLGLADIGRSRVTGTPKPIATTSFTEWGPRVSPDGRWVAYASNESGVFQVYVRPFPGPGGARTQVSADRGETPVWSPDGRRLFYVRGQQVLAATLTTSPALTVTSRQAVLEGDYTLNPAHHTYDVAPDGKQLVLLKPTAGDAQAIVVYNWKAELRRRQTSR